MKKFVGIFEASKQNRGLLPRYTVAGFFYASTLDSGATIPCTGCNGLSQVGPLDCFDSGLMVAPLFVSATYQAKLFATMSKQEQFGLAGQPTPNQTGNVLQLPKYFYLTDTLIDIESILRVKNDLTDVFVTYLALYEEGGEFTHEYASRLFMLFTSLHEILDLIAIQTIEKS